MPTENKYFKTNISPKHLPGAIIYIVLLLLPVHVLFPGPWAAIQCAWAEEAYPESQDPEPGIIDRTHLRISRTVVGTARWFDSFFYDERFEREENRSSLRLRFDSFFEKNEHAVYDVNASLRLILPDTNRRLRLVVAGDPDIESGLVDITNVDNLDQTGQDNRQDLNIGLSYFLIDKLRQNLSLGAGVFVKYDSPQLSLTARYKQLEGLGNWKVRMIPQLSWDTADGWSSKAGIDFDRPLTDILLFRASTQGEWFEHEEGFFYTLAASVFQSLDKKSALAYQWINNFQTEPYNHLHQTALVIRYRRNVWKDWLFLEVAPQIKWSDDKDYEAIPGILLRLETIYGYLG